MEKQKICPSLLLAFLLATANVLPAAIDRQQVVTRHAVEITAFNELNSLSVGNGAFAFTVDPTGLQSFPEAFENGVCLGTMSEWGWHCFPNDEQYKREATIKQYQAGDRLIPYAVQRLDTERKRTASNYFRQNPHRLHLGFFGFQFEKNQDQLISPDEIQSIHQSLNPWTGEIHSRFEVMSQSVQVITLCDPLSDTVAFRISSPLIADGKLKLRLRFPYPTGNHTDSGASLAKATNNLHQSKLLQDSPTSKLWLHELDDTSYTIKLTTTSKVHCEKQAPHDYAIIADPSAQSSSTLEGTLSFHPTRHNIDTPREFDQIRQDNLNAWKHFWNEGGFIDFSGSTDPRSNELERRIILSRYLTRIQCAGTLPPQETGLTFNSWYGKFHLEMHWWHGVHWVLWNQPNLLEKSLHYYQQILSVARTKAQSQGYRGVRWPKMTDPAGEDSPSDVGEFLIWQQPHFIYYADILHRLYPETFAKESFSELVFETADFMASFPRFNEATAKYHLSPPLIPAQERLPKLTTFDPAFELRYWKWALKTAIQWQQSLGAKPNGEYEKVLQGLPDSIAQKGGLYLAAASAPDSYSNSDYMHDHPMVLGALGMLPLDESIDPKIATATFQFIQENWNWPSTWGWDYPMMAMAATRLGNPDAAIDALLMDVQKNTYLPNGHNYQDSRLRIYLPGNGALLTTVAMMCAGFEGSEQINPGFPEEGWNVRWEGLHPVP